MKKLTLVVLSLVLCMGVLVGCGEKQTDLDKIKENISYEQQTLCVGNHEKLTVDVSTGRRETNRLLDGVKGEMSDFAVINITPKNVDMYEGTFTYKIIGDKGEISGECRRAVIGVVQTGDIIDIAKAGTIQKVIVTVGEENIEVAMTDVTHDMIGAAAAVESVYNDCKENMDALMIEGKFAAEILVRLTADRSQAEARYIWYVSVVDGKGNNIYALVNPTSGEIIAKKIKSADKAE